MKTDADGWWMVHTTVRPVIATRRRARHTIAADRLSRPDVGSSQKTTDGLDASSTATVSRFRSPRARLCTSRSASASRSRIRRMSETALARCAGSTLGQRSSDEKTTASRTVSEGR